MGYVTLGFGMRKKDGRAIVVGMRVFLRRQISKTAHQPAPTISATEVRSSGSGRKRVLVSARESGKDKDRHLRRRSSILRKRERQHPSGRPCFRKEKQS